MITRSTQAPEPPFDLEPPLIATLSLPAHERWFVDSAPADWAFFLRPLPLGLTAAVVAVTVLWRLVALRLDRPELPQLRRLGGLVPWVPRLLGVHLGVALLALAASRAFVTPALDDLHSTGGTILLLLEAVLGVWLVTGFQQRIAAALALALGPIMAAFIGTMSLLECANIAAVAAFLVIAPAGADRHGSVTLSATQLRWALIALRAGVGVALVALAFTEKFTNPTMARETLEHFPALNVFSLVGLHVPTDTFIVIAGSIELLFGLLVLSGALPQVAVLVAMVPFNATLFLFGQTELVGHLPVYGVFLALLVYGSNAQTAADVRWLPRPRRPVAASPRRRAGRRPVLRPNTDRARYAAWRVTRHTSPPCRAHRVSRGSGPTPAGSPPGARSARQTPREWPLLAPAGCRCRRPSPRGGAPNGPRRVPRRRRRPPAADRVPGAGSCH